MAALVLPEYYADLAQTTVGAGGYTSGSGSLLVVAAANLSTTRQFHFMITDQSTGAVKCIGKATALVTETYTVTMTTDANANAGDFVTITLCAAAMDQIISDCDQYGTYASLPATVPPAGRRYKGTDCPYDWISNGSIWQAFYRGLPATLPPSAGWTADNLNHGAITYTYGNGYASGCDASYFNIHYRAAPGSTPYSFVARLRVDQSGLITRLTRGLSIGAINLGGFCIGFRDSGGKILVMFSDNGSSGSNLGISYYTTTSGSGTGLANIDSITMFTDNFAENLMFKIRNDGTNLQFWVSLDGNDWQQFYSETITSHLAAATSVFWGTVGQSQNASAMLLDWTQGT